jgi:hypothetical protein
MRIRARFSGGIGSVQIAQSSRSGFVVRFDEAELIRSRGVGGGS